MQLLRYIVFPFTPVYYLATWLRNKLYDAKVKSSKSYTFPLIGVGNLSAGGTGKTPMVEYLIRLLKDDYKLATLSRGYGRETKGYFKGDEKSTALVLGDEPFQFYSKFGKDITVSVCENRQLGIENLLGLQPKPEVILLDDVFQHRKVTPSVSILLTMYSNLYANDWVLPLGNLREPRQGAKRAQFIIVTKCPEDLSETEKQKIINTLLPKVNQKVFFSRISYSKEIIGINQSLALEALSNFTLVTGIANAQPLLDFLKQKGLQFNHLKYKDHYRFTTNTISKFENDKLIVTTEKDYMRLKAFSSIKDKLYYLPIETIIDNGAKFNEAIRTVVAKIL